MEKLLIVITILVLVVVCIMGVSYWGFLTMTTDQMPEPYKGTAIAWMNGTPAPVEPADSENTTGSTTIDPNLFPGIIGPGGYPEVVNVGSTKLHGYKGPTNFICGPIVHDSDNAISDCFGSPRHCVGADGGYTCPHPGIDIGIKGIGYPVTSPISGQVVFAGKLGAYGYAVIIENNGMQVLLGHASQLVLNGEIVQPEQLVGRVIDAGTEVMKSGGCMGGVNEATNMCDQDWRDGKSTGNHTHFEVRTCDEKTGTCTQANNPMSATLPGQTGSCNWYQQVQNPKNNALCTNGQ